MVFIDELLINCFCWYFLLPAVCGSVSPSKTFDGAEFFPVAVGVQVPYVGGGEVSARPNHAPLALPGEYPLKLAPPTLGPVGATLPTGKGTGPAKEEASDKLGSVFSQYNTSSTDKSSLSLPKSYLQKVSNGLNFDDAVLHDRAPHTLPYQEEELKFVFATQGLVRPKPKQIGLVGRHDPRTGIQRHAPCHLHGPRKLRPLKRSKTVPSAAVEESAGSHATIMQKDSKGASTSVEKLQRSGSSPKHEWDEHVLACVSRQTADLILKDHITGPDKERLALFLTKRNQVVEKQEGDGGTTEKAASHREKKRHSSVKKSRESRKSEKSQKEEAQQEIHYSPCFMLPSRVGDKKLETENIFEMEILGGAQPVLLKKPEDDIIVLDSNDKLKFQKQLQDSYPQRPKVWYSQKQRKGKKREKVTQPGQKPIRGLQRWNQLPVVVQVWAAWIIVSEQLLLCRVCYRNDCFFVEFVTGTILCSFCCICYRFRFAGAEMAHTH